MPLAVFVNTKAQHLADSHFNKMISVIDEVWLQENVFDRLESKEGFLSFLGKVLFKVFRADLI